VLCLCSLLRRTTAADNGWARTQRTHAGTSCQHQNQWYYQCLPGGGSGSTLNVWEQCGGKGGNCAAYTCVDGQYPGQTCPSGTACQRKRECWGLHGLAAAMRACLLPAADVSGSCRWRYLPAPADEWYHQCLPNGQTFGTLNLWDQCGGKGGNCGIKAASTASSPASHARPAQAASACTSGTASAALAEAATAPASRWADRRQGGGKGRGGRRLSDQPVA
jgi:hypothetical protein